MSDAIRQSLLSYDPTALSKAKKWMDNCNYITPRGWLSYSKLMVALLSYTQYQYEERDLDDTAWYVVRYYSRALERLQSLAAQQGSFAEVADVLLQLHLSVDAWQALPGCFWLHLQQQKWDLTPLYQWSLDKEAMQEKALQTKKESEYDVGLLHLRMGSTLLEQCFRDLPLMVDQTVHWHLWETFGYENHHMNASKLHDLESLCRATPASFEHAITECYQHHEAYFDAPKCMPLLKMDMTKGHPLTTCHGVLLLYFRFRHSHPALFQTIERRYPLLVQGFNVHLAMYPEFHDALLNANGLMDHWMRAVHGVDNTHELELPSNLVET